MKRRSFARSVGLAGILATGIAPAAVLAQSNIRWRLASSFPKSLDTIYGAGEIFAAKVAELTGGKFQISVHAGGELMPPFGVVDALQQGTVEIGHTNGLYYFGKDPTFAMGTAIPFGLNARQMNAWMMEGNGRKLMREFYREFNIVNFPGGNTGAQMAGWFRKEVKSVADFKGLKMRIGGLAGMVIQRMDAVPQNLPAGEIYQSLEKGTIDAAEWIGPYDDLKLGLHKVAPYYYFPGWWEGGPQIEFYVNTKAFEALPAEYRAAIEMASMYAHTNLTAKYDARNPTALKQLVGEGAKLRSFPRELMQRALQESNALYSDLSAKNPRWKKVYTDYTAFRKDQNLWFRFAEGGFDSFMSAQKL